MNTASGRPAAARTPADAAIDRIYAVGVIPVIRARTADDARRAIDAVREGGISVVEITMTVPGALGVIRNAVDHFGPDILVGAGTVLTPDQVHACLDAGAEYIVSPGFSAAVLHAAQAERRLAIPGVLTATEIMMARAAGATLLKVFPCGPVGGPAYLRALRGPFPDVALVPTGGVTLDNAAQYISAGAWAVGMGSELVHPDALRGSSSTSIVQAVRSLVAAVRSAR